MKKILMERLHCTEKIASLLEQDLEQLHPTLMPVFNKWMEQESFRDETKYHGYSVASLMSERKMTFPAALLTIDWILKNPESACKALSEPVR